MSFVKTRPVRLFFSLCAFLAFHFDTMQYAYAGIFFFFSCSLLVCYTKKKIVQQLRRKFKRVNFRCCRTVCLPCSVPSLHFAPLPLLIGCVHRGTWCASIANWIGELIFPSFSFTSRAFCAGQNATNGPGSCSHVSNGRSVFFLNVHLFCFREES